MSICVRVSYRGYGKDEAIEKAAGKECSGSGYFIPDCTRDMSFYVRSHKRAEQIITQVKKIRGVKAFIEYPEKV